MEIEKCKRQFIVVNTVSGIIAGFVAPIMYVTLKTKGFEVYEVALLVLTSSVLTIFLEIPTGVLSDKLGRKKVFIIGEILLAFFCVSMFLSESFTLIVFAMVASGAAAALMSGTIDALYIDKIKTFDDAPKTIQKSIAVLGATNMLGLFFGALVSSALVLTSVKVLHTSEFEFVYGLVSILLLLHALATAVLIESDVVEKPNVRFRDSGIHLREAAGKLRGRDNLNLLLISGSVSAMAFISIEKLWQIRIHELLGGDSNWVYGCVFAISMLVGAIGQACSNFACRLLNNNYINVVFFIRLVLIGCFLSVYFCDDIFEFITLYLLILFFASASASPVLTLFHDQVQDDERSTMLSYRSVFLQVGASLGIVILSLVSYYFSINETFLTSSFILALSLPILMTGRLRTLGTKLQLKSST